MMETISKRRKIENQGLVEEVVDAEEVKVVDLMEDEKVEVVEEVGVGGTQQHPLLTDLIVENMLRYCSSNELCTARLVCRDWHKASLRVSKTSGPPIILQDGAVVRSHDSSQVVVTKLLENFLNEMHPSPDGDSPPNPDEGRVGNVGIRQYNKFSLHLHSFDCRPLLSSFADACGAWVTHLTLEFTCSTIQLLEDVMLCKFTPNMEHLDVKVLPVTGRFQRSFLFNRTAIRLKSTEGFTPKVKYLKISVARLNDDNDDVSDDDEDGDDDDDVDDAGVDFTFPLDWEGLFTYYSQLEHFVVGRPLPVMLRQVEPIIDAIDQLRSESYTKLNLKSLDLFGDREEHFKEHYFGARKLPPGPGEPWSEDVIESLRRAALPLGTLKLCHPTDMSNEFVHDIISMHGRTLKTLSFCKATLLGESPFLRTPVPNLRNLTLNGYPFKDLSFLEELPTLRSLHLWSKCTISRQTKSKNLIRATPLAGGVEFTSLVEFFCNYPEKWSVRDITILKQLMPNLTHMELALHNGPFRRVCNLWPDLEHLTVYQQFVGDKGIVGRSSSDKPNITCLQKLHTFGIDNLYDEMGLPGTQATSQLTKRSVEQGFLKLPRLQKLRFRVHSLDEELTSVLENMNVKVDIQIPSEDFHLKVLLYRKRERDMA